MSGNDYWNRNIEEWGKFYLGISHSGEELNGARWFSTVYKGTIGRHEAKLMRHRYAATLDFISRRVEPENRVVDVGCGTGIFTLAMLRRGANVVALDYSPRALDLTQQLVKDHSPELLAGLELVEADVVSTPIPECDTFLAVGVTPYIASIESFFVNVVAPSRGGFVSLLDASHWANRLRTAWPWLNVRHLHFPNRNVVDRFWDTYGFRVVQETHLGTGYLQEVEKRSQAT